VEDFVMHSLVPLHDRELRLGLFGLAALATVGLVLVGCGDDDGGDGPPIIVLDAGPDLGGGVDMGMPPPPPPVDMGGPRECERVPEALPESVMGMRILPRCSPETRAAVEACGPITSMPALTCANTAVMRDTTPGLPIGGGQVLDCETCVNYQQLICFANAGCASQLTAVQCCFQDNGCTGGACPACNAQIMAFQTCAGSRPACFDFFASPQGTCFPPAAPPVDAGMPEVDVVADGGEADGGDADAGEADGGGADGGEADGGDADAGEADGGGADAGVPDAGDGDAGARDGGARDAAG
jgi:hypothetical protein